MEIKGRKISVDHPPSIVAEMSGNHKHSMERSLEIVEAASGAGTQMLKLQTYTPCIGDDRCYSYLPSRDGKTLSDKAALHVLKHTDLKFKRYTWLDRGSDER